MISLKNVSRIYVRKQSDENVVALDDVSLNLPDNGFISILGASGSGKTTLLNIIGGLDKASNGELIVDGLSTSSFKGKDWDAYRNEKIGFVLQNCFLLPHLTIKENVALKLQISNRKFQNIDEMVDESLKAVGLYERRNDKPKHLSGGQRQRVAIARAIVGKPTVILADEPTGALDSKTGEQIMTLLKELSKSHLVVMVTHNHEYASSYSDRIIELKDGKIVSDSDINHQEAILNNKKLSKVSFPFFTSLKWGFKNIIVKKYSTLSIVLASSLGLAGVGLILSISSGVKQVFAQTEERALSQYPVTISSYSRQSNEGSEVDYKEFTDEENVFADMSDYAKQEHYNYMSDKFLTYMNDMPKKYYYISYDSSVTNFRVYTQVNETNYRKVSSTSSLFYKGVDDINFINNEYDCLKGNVPTNEHEIALVVDSFNRVRASYLEELGFDIDTSHYQEKKFSFDEIIGKKYRYASNDDYYVYDSVNDIYKGNGKTTQQMYESSTYELTITGILREKKDSGNALFRTGIIYTPAFEKKVITDGNNSEVVRKQKEYHLSKNVLTGQEISDVQSGSINLSADYVYENLLYQLGSYSRITTIYYFTRDFESRNHIIDYFENYVRDEEVDFSTLSYNDYLERVTIQFNGAIKMMTSVLYVFAGISVFVSAILNAILTYISIHQRTSEIGLLRSLGARKKDIGIMIETESLITGVLGGALSIILSLIFISPTNTLITDAIYRYNFYLLSRTDFVLPGFQWWVAPILIGIGVLVSLISAFIPALIASRKDPARALNE